MKDDLKELQQKYLKEDTEETPDINYEQRVSDFTDIIESRFLSLEGEQRDTLIDYLSDIDSHLFMDYSGDDLDESKRKLFNGDIDQLIRTVVTDTLDGSIPEEDASALLEALRLRVSKGLKHRKMSRSFKKFIFKAIDAMSRKHKLSMFDLERLIGIVYILSDGIKPGEVDRWLSTKNLFSSSNEGIIEAYKHMRQKYRVVEPAINKPAYEKAVDLITDQFGADSPYSNDLAALSHYYGKHDPDNHTGYIAEGLLIMGETDLLVESGLNKLPVVQNKLKQKKWADLAEGISKFGLSTNPLRVMSLTDDQKQRWAQLVNSVTPEVVDEDMSGNYKDIDGTPLKVGDDCWEINPSTKAGTKCTITQITEEYVYYKTKKRGTCFIPVSSTTDMLQKIVVG